MKKLTFTKVLVLWLIFNGTVWTYLSYALAYLGRTAALETLSRAVVQEILGVALLYCVKALVENVFKNNEIVAKKRNDDVDGE